MNLLKFRSGRRPRTQPERVRRTVPLCLLQLEDRCLLSYSVTDLGTLGGLHSWAYGINDAGNVVGAAMVTGFRYSHAYLYSGGSLTDLGVLKGKGIFSTGQDINTAGQIVGSSNYTTGNATLYHAFVYKLVNGTPTMVDLGALGGPNSYGTGINNGGLIVGYANYTGGAMDKYHAFRYNLDNTKTDLGTLGGDNSQAYDINDAGQIVGVASTGSENHAFIWQNGTMTDIGVLPGYTTGSEAQGVNSLGAVVGGSFGLFGVHQTVIYHGFLYSNGTLTDLGNLGQGGNYSYAFDINDLGQAVGTANTTFGDSPHHAFLWQSGTMTDLNSLIPSGTGWVLSEADAINNNGQIVGWGFLNGKMHAFLVTPGTSPSGEGRGLRPRLDALTAQSLRPTNLASQLTSPATPSRTTATPPAASDVAPASSSLATTTDTSNGRSRGASEGWTFAPLQLESPASPNLLASPAG
jgi:probable HAF family extracellular repeat protein